VSLANNSKIWSKRTSNKNDNYKEMDRKHTGTKYSKKLDNRYIVVLGSETESSVQLKYFVASTKFQKSYKNARIHFDSTQN
jgi:hypothetical protein